MISLDQDELLTDERSTPSYGILILPKKGFAGDPQTGRKWEKHSLHNRLLQESSSTGQSTTPTDRQMCQSRLWCRLRRPTSHGSKQLRIRTPSLAMEASPWARCAACTARRDASQRMSPPKPRCGIGWMDIFHGKYVLSWVSIQDHRDVNDCRRLVNLFPVGSWWKLES